MYLHIRVSEIRGRFVKKRIERPVQATSVSDIDDFEGLAETGSRPCSFFHDERLLKRGGVKKCSHAPITSRFIECGMLGGTRNCTASSGELSV